MKRNFKYVNRLPSAITVILATFLLMQFYACKNKNGNADSSMENMKMDEGDTTMKNMDMGNGSMEGMDMSGNDSSAHKMNAHDGKENMPMNGEENKNKQHALSVNTANLKVNDLLQPSNQTVIAQISTVSPKTKTMDEPVIANGTIDYDQRRFSNVASRFNGRIEKLYVKYNLQKVLKGQKLFDIYSPELVTAQQDYIFLLNDTSAKTLVAASEKKLQLLGLSNEQITSIRNTKKAVYAFTIYSTLTGYVVWEEYQQKNISSPQQSSNSGMNGMSNSNTTPMPSSMSASVSSRFLKEGQYVSKGETVFGIVNTEKMWALVKIFREDLNRVSVGNKAEIILENSDSVLTAKVDFVQPYFISEDKSATLRIYLDNSNGQIRAGNFFKAKIYSSALTAIWIPREAVLDLGNTKIVFLKEGNLFRTAQIKTGAVVNNFIAVLSGLSADSKIAFNAQYLIDSEAFIKTE